MTKTCSLILASLFAFGEFATAENFNSIEYLCADLGPAMTLPAKAGDKPQLSDTEDEVYFLKQLTSFTRESLKTPDLFTGAKARDVVNGSGIYLCKMKGDGSGKTEIKELWHNPAYPIDTQGQSTWMSVNGKTRRIALSIRYAGADTIGLWTMNFDGSELRRILPSASEKPTAYRVNHPSWTPDGKCIVFEQEGGGKRRIVKCDADGKEIMELTDSDHDETPCVSPDGRQIAFIHWIRKGDINDSWLWLIGVDGNNSQPLPNPDAKSFWTAKAHWGTYPAWSPDGKRIFLLGITSTIVDAHTGKDLVVGALHRAGIGWPQWGRSGLLCTRVCGIGFGDLETKNSKVLGACTTVECKRNGDQQCRW